MQVVAASVLDTVGRFLHSGYVSAYPPTQVSRDILTPEAYPVGAVPELQLDVAEALRLQGEQLAAVVSSGDTTMALAAVAGGTPWGTLLAGALCASGLVVGHRLLSRQDPLATRWRARPWHWALASSVATTLALVVACGDYGDGGGQGSAPPAEASPAEVAPATDATPAEGSVVTPVDAEPAPVEPEPVPVVPDPPWVGVELRSYQNPEAATQVILHGLIGNAIRHRYAVGTLADLARDIALPASTLTEGEAYALKTYAFDGWGRELALVQENNTFTVTSSGEDGVLATEDDLVLHVPTASLSSSSGEAMVAPTAWYVVEPQQTPCVLFFHPPIPDTQLLSGSMIEYVNHVPNEALAAEVTGGGGFGLFTIEQLPAAAPDLQARYDAMAAAVAYKPLLLEVFGAQT